MTRRIATPNDLGSLVELRLAFIADVRGWGLDELSVEFADASRRFLTDAMAAGTLTSWLDEDDDGAAVGVVALLHRDAPPLPDDLRRQEGFIINLYVVPDARGRGRARGLLDELLRAAPGLGITKFALHATDEGRHLYESSVFTPDPTWMSRIHPP